jgi:hypothetical protein
MAAGGARLPRRYASVMVNQPAPLSLNARRDWLLRCAVLLLSALEAAAVLVLAWWGLHEGGGLRIAAPLTVIAAVVVAVCVLPALALAYAGKLLWLATFLAIIPVLVALYGRFG